MRLKIISALFLYFSAAGEFLSAQKYYWPTNASKAITSTFSEFRPGHFHSGIDIKTWNREGYKIFAVSDGYISRVRVSPYGYGKVIYQKLSDGNTAVYAHLRSFTEDIEKVIKKNQNSSGEYRVDIQFKSSQYPVKRGETIALSGKTGTKYPHLHFEIRDSRNNPMNPLAFGFKIKDAVHPTPVRLAFIPLENGSEIDGGFTDKTYKLHRVGKYVYQIKDTVQIYGKIGIALSAYDMANDIPNKYGVNSFRLKIDGVEYFRANYETFSFDNTRQIEVDREYRLWRKGKGLFHSLYVKPYNTMPFYSNRSDGSLDSSVMPGLHSYEIEVSDYYGNKSIVRGAFVYNTSHSVNVSLTEFAQGQYKFKFSKRGVPLSRVKISGYLPGKGYVKLSSKTIGKNKTSITTSLTINSQLYGHLRIDGHDIIGASLLPVFVSLREEKSKVENDTIKFEIYDKHMAIIYTHSELLSEAPVLRLKNGQNKPLNIPLRQTEAFRYEASVPLDILTTLTILSVIDGSSGDVLYEDVLSLNQISHRTGGTLVSGDGNFMVQFDENSLYGDYYGDVIIEDIDDFGNIDKNLVTPVYKISPNYQPMKEIIKVLLRYPHTTIDREKLGMYYHDMKEGWVFLKSDHDTSMTVMSTDVLSLESFAVLSDMIPPKISKVTPLDRSVVSKENLRISAEITDDLSGIEDERSIQFKLDGKKLIFEWHPASNTATYVSDRNLSKGKHRLQISAVDNARNESVINFSFYIR